MKRYLTISLFLTASAVCGQGNSLYERLVHEGNVYFEEEQYNLAIGLYQDAMTFNVSNPTVDYRLAECYRHTFNYPEAEVYYMKVLYTGQTGYPLALYYYALMLKLNGNLTEAMQRFDQFISLHETDASLKDFAEQAIIEKAGCEIAQHEFGTTSGFRAVPVAGSVNSPYNDFAPAFRNVGTLVITSSRITSNRKLIDERNGEAFTDNYYFELAAGQWEDKTRAKFATTNSLYHDGTGAFTKNGDRYFFAVCEQQCRIYETHIADNKWTQPALLSEAINYPGADSKQPAISPGGDTLYFASNRPGGYGAFDIWMSINAGGNGWSPAQNAGRTINTRANDIAPTTTDLPSVLFFSSEGHPGYGGFDLFVAKADAGKDTVLYNLDLPFNSVRDDCFLTFGGEEMLWSSNRAGGKGGFDIYVSQHVTAIGLVSRLALKSRNDSRMVTLTSRTARSETVHLLASRNEETIDYNNLTYERKAIVNKMIENRLVNARNRREDFADISQEEFEVLNEISHVRFQTMLLKEKYASRLLTEIQPTADARGPLSVTGELVDSRNGRALTNAKVLLANEYGEILKITRTNDEGHFRFTDVDGGTRLFLRLEEVSGHGRSRNADRPSAVNAFARNIETLGSDKPNALYVENVYFDFDHYVIRPEGAQVLEELASYLMSNPGAQVEIYAFADDRGSSAYNFELTQKRGEAVVAFLTRRGVDETSLAIIPKGKQAMRLATNELQRQYNRRAEFYINGVRETFTPSVKTYILRKEADWGLLAKATGISKDELKSLNGSLSEKLKPFQPVRLPISAKAISEDLFFVGI
jgi:tetratricopeptide (TPR) repeat protein